MIKRLTAKMPRRGQSYTEWRDEWADALVGRDLFTAASITSHGYRYRTDQLPAEWVADYRATADHENSYVVSSYDTPIAWVDAEGNWVVPFVKYSRTTSNHQSRVTTALDHLDRDGTMRVRTTTLAA